MKNYKIGTLIVCVICLGSLVIGCGNSNKAYYVEQDYDNKNAIESVSNDDSQTISESRTDSIIQESDGWISASEAFEQINVGWNLGNSLDCYKGDLQEASTKSLENSWGLTATSKETIDAVAQQGFKLVRIPVTYRSYIDENGQIQEFWLDRVEEVVNYVLDDDMYCVINVHHDTGSKGWIIAEPDNYQANEKLVTNLWTQIANRFKDYDEKLMFEGFNEMLDYEGEWSNAKDRAYEVVNDYNQLFVDTVRATGGNNEFRNLVLNTYAAKSEAKPISLFKLPKDLHDNHLAVGVHIYCGADSIDWFMDNAQVIIDEGVSVFVGEFGIQAADASTEKRVEFVDAFLTAAAARGITCAWWDDGYQQEKEGVRNFALMNRITKEWYFPELVDKLVEEY